MAWHHVGQIDSRLKDEDLIGMTTVLTGGTAVLFREVFTERGFSSHHVSRSPTIRVLWPITMPRA